MAVAQAGDLGCRQSGLKWINLDALVTPHRDYQMKRQEQIRYCCSSPVSLSLNSPARGGKRNHGAMKHSYRMLFLRVSLCSHACIYSVCTAGDELALRKGRNGVGCYTERIVELCPNALSLQRRTRYGSRHKCALESLKYHPNVRWWVGAWRNSPSPGGRLAVIDTCAQSSAWRGAWRTFTWVTLLAQPTS